MRVAIDFFDGAFSLINGHFQKIAVSFQATRLIGGRAFGDRRGF